MLELFLLFAATLSLYCEYSTMSLFALERAIIVLICSRLIMRHCMNDFNFTVQVCYK